MARVKNLRSKVKGLLKRSKYLPQGIAASLSVMIIALIVFAPTASAISVDILGATNSQSIGHSGKFKFVAHVNVNSGELIPLETLNLILDGQTFSFNPSTGEPIGTESPAVISVDPVNFPVGQLNSPSYGYTYGYFLGNSYGSGYSYGSPYGYGYGVAGPRTLNYLITLNASRLAAGSHTIQIGVVAALSPTSTYTSSTVTINVVENDVSEGDQVSETNPPVIDHSVTTNVKVLLTGATYSDGSVGGTITSVKFNTKPNTLHTIESDTGGKKGAKWVDVKSYGFTAGTATITITYTDAEIAAAGLNENTLTLYYYNTGTNTWTALTGIVRDTVANTVTGQIDVTLLTGTYVSLAGSTAAVAGPPLIIAPGNGVVSTSTTSTSTTTSTTTTTSTSSSSTSPTPATTKTITSTKTATGKITSTTTRTLQTTTVATSTSTAIQTSTATTTLITTSITTITRGDGKIITSTITSTSTVTSGKTNTHTETSTFVPPGVTVTMTRAVGASSEIAYAAIVLAVMAVIAAAVLFTRRPRNA